MNKLALVLTFAAAVTCAASGVARAEIGTADQVPAATVLLPYFQVDLNNPDAVKTTFSINNASATAILAHVTLWTDEGIPTLNFNVYLTGYDLQQINLNDLFTTGKIPVTASAGQDPSDTISPKGPASQDINFASCTGVLPGSGVLTDVLLTHLRRAHTGRRSDVLNGCVSAEYGDLVARGYVTVDTVNSCNTQFPSDPGYFTSVATFQNVLWGDYTVQDDANNFSVNSALVPIEACFPGGGYLSYVGNGAGFCPFAAGDYTFYGRLDGFDGSDQREPLATTFATRYVTGGAFDATDLLVWRDTKLPPTGANGNHHCGTNPAWLPLSDSQVVAFDEAENPTELCAVADDMSPASGQTCFPLATQRVNTATGNALAKPIAPPAAFGWLYLNLNHAIASDPEPGVAQAWVETAQSAIGRFSVGLPAIALDNATTAGSGGVVFHFPP